MKFSLRAPPPALLLAAVAWLLAIGQLPGGTAVQISRAGKTCLEYPVEAREEQANVVISGYIQRIMRKPRTILYDCDVEVVRVFKGYEELHEEVDPPMQGNLVQVGGFGDPMICDNTVTPGDTRIFMVNKNGNGHLMLNSSVIRITLNNLVQAEAAVFDVPFVTRKPERKGPCDMVLCIFGATCIENEGRPQCVCDRVCPEVFAPVCGSDGVTYASECFLKRASCEQKRRISFKSQGECEERDPCQDIQCNYGGECVIEGDEASCICPDICLLAYDPVCGSDGMTYSNDCQLKAAACHQQTEITVQSTGQCVERDPCDNVTCNFGASCVTDGNTWVCLCPEICLEVYSPVCGSDGMDYGNECELNVAACSLGKNITIVFQGSCDPCRDIQYEDAVCKLDRSRQPEPSCEFDCTAELSTPVCGSDGMTYENECELTRAACLSNLENQLIVFTEGVCEIGSHPCEDQMCDFGLCVTDSSGVPQCVCVGCPDIYVPVCGSDSVTYNSRCHLDLASCNKEVLITVVEEGTCPQEQVTTCTTPACEATEGALTPVCGTDDVDYPSLCALQQAACDQDKTIEVASNGFCDKCNEVECILGASCQMRAEGPTCVCSDHCEMVNMPVCGSDGETYASECKLNVMACTNQKNITVVSYGNCDDCLGVTCRTEDYNEVCYQGVCVCQESCALARAEEDNVCGTDGKTYDTLCAMQAEACVSQSNLSVESYGPCENNCRGVVCNTELFNEVCYYGVCVCQESCPTSRSEEDNVCGTDDETYDTICHLKAAACRSQSNLTVEAYGPCESSGSGSGTIPPEIIQVCDDVSCGFGGICRPLSTEEYQCVCNFNCPAVRSPVCGTDSVTYGNDCQRREAACEQQASIILERVGTCEDIEIERCDGESPLVREGTTDLYTCNEDNRGEDCPSGSYCHIHPLGTFSVCCPVNIPGNATRPCLDSEFGCCPDNETEALGENYEGCPSKCNCNELGSYSKYCEPVTEQCPCKPGIGGKNCDRCEPGFYDFLALEQNSAGCKPCGCNIGGSRRDDCDQTTGVCSCKKGVDGDKCNICPTSQVMTPTGCVTEETMPEVNGITCAELTCRFYAQCMEGAMQGQNATCVCPSLESCANENIPVCGDNNMAYGSRCQLEVVACREQKNLMVKYEGACETTVLTPTPPQSHCQQAQWGCCHDNQTLATGPDGAGCEHLTEDSVIGTTTQEVMVYGCDSSPCQHGGTCRNEAVAPGFSCDCPVGKGGPVCDKAVSFDTPSFSGDSYLAFASMDGFFEVEINIEFQTNSTEGVLLYNAQNDEGTGDFVSLAIVDNRVEFRFLSTDQSNGFDLGRADPVVIRSAVELEPMRWHTVRAYRSRRDGTVSVDEEPEVAGSSSGASGALNLGEELFIGNAFPPAVGLELVNASNGFIGCIRNVEVNSKVLDLSSTNLAIEYGANVGECGHDPCKELPCLNNGTCDPVNAETYRCVCMEPYLGPKCGDVLADQCEGNMCYVGSSCVPLPEGGYRCDCQEGWKGELCGEEIPPDCVPTFNVADTCIPAFSGDSYIEHPSLRLPRQFVITVEFYPTSTDGMVFYNGQKDTGNGDFVSLNLHAGYLEFRFDLGRGIADIRSSKVVELNEWHVVRVMRRDSGSIQGEMILDNLEPVFGSSPPGASELNLNRNLFIGGSRNYNQLSRKASITDGFDGAIRTFVVDGVTLDWPESAIASVNVDVFTQDTMDTIATTDASKTMKSTMASTRRAEAPILAMTTTLPSTPPMTTPPVVVVDVNAPVRFDGQTSIQYYNGITRSQRALRNNIIQLSFKTDQLNGAILWNGVGNKDFQAVGVSEGFAEFAYNLGKGITRIRSAKRVDDNKWHTVVVTRNLIAASLQVDDSLPEMGQARAGASQLDTDGQLFLGRGVVVPGSMASSYTYYTGCIADVLLDENRMHLYENARGEKPSQFCQGP